MIGNVTRIFIFTLAIAASACHAMMWNPERGDQCESAIREIVLEDRATAVDDTPTRLHSTWLSQDCEVRAGPEYIIRKYTFYENGTFLLLRHHYAEDSCSVATHTVTARGSIRLLSQSIITPGATEARFHLDTVHIVPLNRQVALKFAHRVNVSCSPQPKWRPYVAQLVYEQSSSSHASPLWQGPRYNSFHGHLPAKSQQQQQGLDCLEPLGIEFGELRLLRVQKRPFTAKFSTAETHGRPRVELYFGSLPPNAQSRRSHRPTSLQSTALLRMDTTNGCPICGPIYRGTEFSPPLLHEAAALPALIGGSWLSLSCESIDGGLWMKRQLQVYSGDKLWTGRWDYYADPKCMTFLYAITAAGSYLQRPGKQRFNNNGGAMEKIFEDNIKFVDVTTTTTTTTTTTAAPSFESDEEDYPIIKDKEPKNNKHRAKLFFKGRKLSVAEQTAAAQVDKQMAEAILSADKGLTSMKKPLADWITPELASDIYYLRLKKTLEEEEDSTNREKRDLLRRKHHKVSISTSDKKAKSNNNKNSVKDTTTTVQDLVEAVKDYKRKSKRSVVPEQQDSYRHLLQNAQPSMAESFAAILRGNQRREETTKKPAFSTIPAGNTELDLHVAESLLIPGDAGVFARCGAQSSEDDGWVLGGESQRGKPLVSWPRNCVPNSLEAPSTMGLRARIGVNWSGQYILMLGQRDDNLWQAPLHQCGPTASHNPELRVHLRRSVGLRYGLLSSAGASSLGFSQLFTWSALVIQQILVLCLVVR